MTRLGQTEAAAALLVTAMNTATELPDPIELASGLAEIGFHALPRWHAEHGEAQFRDSLTLPSMDGSADLCARLHHGLALALSRCTRSARILTKPSGTRPRRSTRGDT